MYSQNGALLVSPAAVVATDQPEMRMNTKTSSRKPAATVSITRAKAKTTVATPVKSKTAETARGRVTRSKEVLAVPAANVFSGSKQAGLIAMLRNPVGANIEKLMALTGWQSHTIRGTISGVLRKKLGLNVTCEPSAKSGTRMYRIAE